MKIKFKVNQGECLRKGINAPRSFQVIDLNVAEMPQNERDMIADRTVGIMIHSLDVNGDKIQDRHVPVEGLEYSDLIEAINIENRENEAGLSPQPIPKLSPQPSPKPSPKTRPQRVMAARWKEKEASLEPANNENSPKN